MASRNLLAMSQSKDFKKWLLRDGWILEKPIGTWERIRARKGKRIFIAYQRSGAKTHYSTSDKDAGVVHAYLKFKRLWDLNPCLAINCGCYDSDMGCTMPSIDKSYACSLEPELTEEDFMTEDELKERRRDHADNKRALRTRGDNRDPRD